MVRWYYRILWEKTDGTALSADDASGFWKRMSDEKKELAEVVRSIARKADTSKFKKEYLFGNEAEGKDEGVSIENFFEHFFEKTEGSGCSADKARFVVRSLKKALGTGEAISFDAKYKDLKPEAGSPLADMIVKMKPEELEEKPYWYPDSVKDTDQAFDLYYSVITQDFRYYRNFVVVLEKERKKKQAVLDAEGLKRQAYEETKPDKKDTGFRDRNKNVVLEGDLLRIPGHSRWAGTIAFRSFWGDDSKSWALWGHGGVGPDYWPGTLTNMGNFGKDVALCLDLTAEKRKKTSEKELK